ncbi:FAD:protein FMN transferase [Arenibacter sp. N53]|uniref:FAD:protein FMN transferase n=1 Tax=Arenibacter TaxID=178469 RepID=UPI000CD48132|nr:MULTISPECIES: FAD:protein FMN transferase [Arenibacter]MCM4150853.1 FAD:protein FMN transferase [Arenibacter sp. N53]
MYITFRIPIVILLFVFHSISIAQTRYEYAHQQMGTQIGLVFYQNESDAGRADSIAELVFKRIDELNGTLSNYLPESEINRLSSSPNINVTVSDDLFRLMQISVVYAARTNGAFDITLGPLIELWRKARQNKEVPLIGEMQLAIKSIGYGNLEFPAGNIIKLSKEGMRLDVGGIGKGFAADEAINLLKRHGITAALVDMGGDITVSDAPPNKKFWVLGFSYIDKNGGEVFQKIKLKNQAVATSGDLYQYAMIDGKRYSHIIDPYSGKALNNNIQVTTIAPNGTMADAYASALSVLGVVNGKQFIQETPNLEVFMVEDVPGAYQQWNSSGFLNYIMED